MVSYLFTFETEDEWEWSVRICAQSSIYNLLVPVVREYSCMPNYVRQSWSLCEMGVAKLHVGCGSANQAGWLIWSSIVEETASNWMLNSAITLTHLYYYFTLSSLVEKRGNHVPDADEGMLKSIHSSHFALILDCEVLYTTFWEGPPIWVCHGGREGHTVCSHCSVLGSTIDLGCRCRWICILLVYCWTGYSNWQLIVLLRPH